MKDEIRMRCQNCGGLLDVDRDCRFVTCAACGTELEVVRKDAAVFTRPVQGVAPPVAEKAERVEPPELAELKRQNELLRLDHEWEVKRHRLMGRNRYGGYYVPTYWGVWLNTGVFVVVAIMAMASGAGAVGVFVLLLGVLVPIAGANRVAKYREAEDQYWASRRKVEQGKDEAKNTPDPASR